MELNERVTSPCRLGHSSRFSTASPEEESDHRGDDDKLKLQWVAIESLPTFRRVRMSLFDNEDLTGGKLDIGKSIIDVTKLGNRERQVFIGKLVKDIEEDNSRLLKKLKERIHRVGLELPSIEVRYKNLSIEAQCEVVHGKPLPTLWNTLMSFFSALTQISGCKSKGAKLEIIKDVSGIIRPSRMTLLLGPPGCGKTILLKALAGILNHSLKVSGEITYNGHKFEEFVPQKTASYISQNDIHNADMTVRETLDFSARCQGIGGRSDIMEEVNRREKQAGIIPEPDIDTYMKAISVEGLKRSLQTDYLLKILGLETCANTIVGDAMKRGISGGQKKRLTTGEMIIGPTKALLMDEISNGLDTSTTFQVAKYLQQLAHITDSTVLVSLLQPAPETFELFDDVILMAEGRIVYHGPRDHILEFFEQCGFHCPPRKGVADFLQEVVSKKDQEKYWHREEPYNYVSVDKFGNMFKNFHVGKELELELSLPFEITEQHKSALAFSIYSLKKWELLKACMSREWLLMKRNSFVYVFTSIQITIMSLITMTVFLRTRMKVDEVGAEVYMGSLFYALVRLMVNGVSEMGLTVSRLALFYKQRDSYFFPSWSYSIPAIILKIPLSLLDSLLWIAITYYVIDYSPEPERFLKQFLLLFLLHQVSISQFRLVASVFRNRSVAGTCGLFIIVAVLLFSGFVIPQSSLPSWLGWGFWLSPLPYGQIGIAINEFNAPRWNKVSSSNMTIGEQALKNRGLDFGDYFYWISVGALLVFWTIFNIGFTCALNYLKPPGQSRTSIISHKKLLNIQGSGNILSEQEQMKASAATRMKIGEIKRPGISIPFEPATITFENVQYFVDTPKNLRKEWIPEKKLQLLQDITGSFRPGVLTALMGVSGAGKTTLMDVLSGRKTGGFIEGDIRIGGYPKVQETYRRVSGYCEQTDVQSPNITVGESVAFSAWLRLPAETDRLKRSAFVDEVLQIIELDEIRDELVGVPGVNGISGEQRKRLTIAVELVSNPSIIFMDEPTTGLDARAAAIVMRVVKNIVNTRRTIVCTIHQPNIDIFDAFDELILMKRGKIIYSGEVGHNSNKLIEYFEDIPGLPKIKDNYNPATWMLEVTNDSFESQLGFDFSLLYENSHLSKKNKERIAELRDPPHGSEDLKFSTRFPQNGYEQYKACLWRHNLSYWRNPKYNLGRLIFVITCSLLFGALLWNQGQKIDDKEDFKNMMNSMFVLMLFMGIGNCVSVIPIAISERTTVYRERFAGMYSSQANSFSQVTVEVVYVLVQAALFSGITYPLIGFQWSVYKAFWYLYTVFCTLLYFNYFGLLLASLTPSYQVASVGTAFFFSMWNLFAGYLIPRPKIPKWWVWAYWTCPTAWSLKALITSQYGDLEKQILGFNDEPQTLKAFMNKYYGFAYDDLPIAFIVLLALPLAFLFAFTCANAKLNFQNR